MAKFRKKPIVIEVVRVYATDFNGISFDGNPFGEPVPKWFLTALETGVVSPHTRGSTDYAEWDIKTLEGTMNASPGDWIIRGVNGQLYPCKPDVFEKTYESSDPV